MEILNICLFFPQELKTDFAEHENMLDALEKQNRELLANASDKQKREVNHAMEEVHSQWKLMQVKFEELKARPSREMESDFVSYHGQILSTVDGIQRSLKKIRLTSSEPREIKLQLDQCKVRDSFIHRIVGVKIGGML